MVIEIKSVECSEKRLYQNLKHLEFDKEIPQNYCSELAAIVDGQGASESNSSEASTRTKTSSSSCFAIKQDLRKELAERNACFVLITCGEPTEDGKMEVEMTYEGDASLAAYLIESAQGFIE